MGNVACNCKKKEEVEEITVDEPILSKTPGGEQSGRENGLSVRESERIRENNIVPKVSSREGGMVRTNSDDNMKVEINEDDK
jgi:hypothetical protein